MSKNNPVENIPTHLPMLSRLEKALMNEYLNMHDDEIAMLWKEISLVTETNCSAMKYDIAMSFKDTVNSYYKRYIENTIYDV